MKKNVKQYQSFKLYDEREIEKVINQYAEHGWELHQVVRCMSVEEEIQYFLIIVVRDKPTGELI